MENISGIPAKKHWVSFVLLWLFGAAIVVACGGNDDEPQLGHQIILSGNAVLTCSQECRERGQCGVVAGTENQVVLVGGPEQPTTSPRQFAMPIGSVVTINGEPQSLVLVLASDVNAQETVNFYSVAVVDKGNAPGWVAGWCLAAPAP